MLHVVTILLEYFTDYSIRVSRSCILQTKIARVYTSMYTIVVADPGGGSTALPKNGQTK